MSTKKKNKRRTNGTKANSRRRETRRAFSGFTHFAPIGYVSVDPGGDIVDVNPAGGEVLGESPADLIGRPLAALLVAENREALARFLKKARRDATRGDASLELKATTGSNRFLKLIARRAVTADRGRLLVAMVDLTKERRFENERREALVHQQARADDLAHKIAHRADAEARIKALLERLVTAQEEERRRIARNLHDHLGQQLTALRLALDAIGRDQSTPEPLRKRITLAEQIVTKMDRDVDLLAWDLRPATLDDAGLPAALSELVRQWTSVSQVTAEFHQSTPDDFRLADDIESNIYRIVQEALNNIAKHAAATHVSVLLEHRGEEAAVIIEDNGRGFDPDQILSSPDRRAMMGLLGMRERAALIEGEVQIESRPGQGTTVFVRIPVRAQQRSG